MDGDRNIFMRYNKEFAFGAQIQQQHLIESWIASQANSPSVGVVHVVLAVQPDRLGVQLDGLCVLLGGKVLVAKPATARDTQGK